MANNIWRNVWHSIWMVKPVLPPPLGNLEVSTMCSIGNGMATLDAINIISFNLMPRMSWLKNKIYIVCSIQIFSSYVQNARKYAFQERWVKMDCNRYAHMFGIASKNKLIWSAFCCPRVISIHGNMLSALIRATAGWSFTARVCC